MNSLGSHIICQPMHTSLKNAQQTYEQSWTLYIFIHMHMYLHTIYLTQPAFLLFEKIFASLITER